MKLLVCFCAASLMYAAAVAVAPSIGYVLSAEGRLSRVMGVAGAVIVEPAVEETFESAAYSGRLLLALSNGELHAESAPDGRRTSVPADLDSRSTLFGFSPAGTSGIAYSVETGIAKIWTGSEWRDARIDPSTFRGGVLAVSLSGPGRLTALVARDGLSQVRIRLSDGAIEDDRNIRPEANGPAALLPTGGIVYTVAGTTILRHPSGLEQTLELPPGVTAFTSIGPGWLQAGFESGARHAIRAYPNVRVVELPEAPQ